jgi:cytochrome P450
MSATAITTETTPPENPTFDLAMMNSEKFLRDPFTPLRQLREQHPVFRAGHGHWILTRHADCRAMFTDARLKNIADRRCFPDAESNEKIHAVDPDNTASVVLRKVAVKQFTPGPMKRLRPRIQEIVDELVDAMLEAGETCLVEAFGVQVAGRVACEYFGVPHSDRTMFRGWIDTFVACGDTIRGENDELDRIRRESIDNLMAYLATLIPQRRHQPTEDMMGQMVVAMDAVDPELTDQRLPNVMAALLMSGYETTNNFLSGAPYELLRNPSELRRLQENPEIIVSGVRELMRYYSPGSYIARTASTDLELAGQSIAEREVVVAVLAAANRDPEVFEDPDRLDLTRNPNPHLGFGHGPHGCVGSVLTETEAQIALTTLFRRIPALALKGEPTYKKAFAMRGFTSMPVTTVA